MRLYFHQLLQVLSSERRFSKWCPFSAKQFEQQNISIVLYLYCVLYCSRCRCRVFTCKRRFEALLPSDSLMGHPWARCSTHLASRSGLRETMTSRWWMVAGSNLQIMNLMVSVIKMLGRRASLRSQWSGLSSMYVDTAAEEGNGKPLQYSP